MSKSNNNANATRPETMAQKHARLYRESPLVCFIAEVRADWPSGDMALSRMETVVTSELGFLTRVKGYNKVFGKQERGLARRLADLDVEFLDRSAAREIAAYLARCIEFVEANGWVDLTADGIFVGEMGSV